MFYIYTPKFLLISVYFYIFSDHEPPPAMLKLHAIADKEDGWIQVVSSMVNVIPMHNPLGPSVIILLLDDCPLPSKVDICYIAKNTDHNKSNNNNIIFL